MFHKSTTFFVLVNNSEQFHAVSSTVLYMNPALLNNNRKKTRIEITMKFQRDRTWHSPYHGVQVPHFIECGFIYAMCVSECNAIVSEAFLLFVVHLSLSLLCLWTPFVEPRHHGVTCKCTFARCTQTMGDVLCRITLPKLRIPTRAVWRRPVFTHWRAMSK